MHCLDSGESQTGGYCLARKVICGPFTDGGQGLMGRAEHEDAWGINMKVTLKQLECIEDEVSFNSSFCTQLHLELASFIV